MRRGETLFYRHKLFCEDLDLIILLDTEDFIRDFYFDVRLIRLLETMSRVIKKFFIASMIMWIAPVAILYGFNNHAFPGTGHLSSSSQTLVSGFLAVISVNLVIGIYIFMALKEPSNREHQPDPAFLADAKASINQTQASTATSNDSAETKEKAE